MAMERHVKFFTFLLHNFLALHFYYSSSYCFTLSSVSVICSKWLGTLSRYDSWILPRHFIVKFIYNRNFEVEMKLLQFKKIMKHQKIQYHICYTCESGVATCHGLDSFGFEPWWRPEIFSSHTHPDRSWSLPSLLYDGYWDLRGRRVVVAWLWPPIPF
jgi:hypothetical protein